jgi:hypothetical protein
MLPQTPPHPRRPRSGRHEGSATTLTNLVWRRGTLLHPVRPTSGRRWCPRGVLRSLSSIRLLQPTTAERRFLLRLRCSTPGDDRSAAATTAAQPDWPRRGCPAPWPARSPAARIETGQRCSSRSETLPSLQVLTLPFSSHRRAAAQAHGGSIAVSVPEPETASNQQFGSSASVPCCVAGSSVDAAMLPVQHGRRRRTTPHRRKPDGRGTIGSAETVATHAS